MEKIAHHKAANGKLKPVPFGDEQKRVVDGFFGIVKCLLIFLCLSVFFCFGGPATSLKKNNWISEPWHVMMFFCGWLVASLVGGE